MIATMANSTNIILVALLLAIFLVSLIKLITQFKIFKVRTAIILMMTMLIAISILVIKHFLMMIVNEDLSISLFRVGLVCLFLLIFISVLFYEDVYEGHFNSLLLTWLALLLGYNLYYYLYSGVTVIYINNELVLDIVATPHLILYEASTTAAAAYFGSQIYFRGRKKFSKSIFRDMIHVFGLFSFINFIILALFSICLINLQFYYQIRIALRLIFIIYFMLLAIITIWRPGFYLVNAYNAYYFVVYDRKSGIPIYIRDYTGREKTLDLLSNLLTALEHLSDEIIRTKVHYIVTEKHAIVIESIGNIGASITVEKYHPNVSKLLRLFLMRVVSNLEKNPRVKKILDSGIILGDIVKKEIERDVRNTLSYILP